MGNFYPSGNTAKKIGKEYGLTVMCETPYSLRQGERTDLTCAKNLHKLKT